MPALGYFGPAPGWGKPPPRLSRPDSAKGWYLAAFNMRPRMLTLSWPALALPAGRYEIRDLWQHRDQGAAATLTVHLDGHGTALYRLQPR